MDKKIKDISFYQSSRASTNLSPSGINISIFLLKITILLVTQQRDRINTRFSFFSFLSSRPLNCKEKLQMTPTLFISLE